MDPEEQLADGNPPRLNIRHRGGPALKPSIYPCRQGQYHPAPLEDKNHVLLEPNRESEKITVVVAR